jgi:hypothetical protein
MENLNLSELKDVAASRKNALGFLHHSDIKKINDLIQAKAPDFEASGVSYTALVAAILSSQATPSAKKKALVICIENNNLLREFRYRYTSNTKDLFEYCEKEATFIFFKKCDMQEYCMNYASIER